MYCWRSLQEEREQFYGRKKCEGRCGEGLNHHREKGGIFMRRGVMPYGNKEETWEWGETANRLYWLFSIDRKVINGYHKLFS